MRADTLKQISGELCRARKKHPARGAHLALLKSYANELEDAVFDHHRGVQMQARSISASQIYALAATVAALAVRIMEEGVWGFSYQGNVQAPDFKLTTVENDRAD